MIVNGKTLYAKQPIVGMIDGKHRAHGVSYGLTEAGYDLRIAEAVTLHPFKRFSLAYASEPFAMPIDLVGVVHDKSTWARRGLSVFNTVIEPGWHGASSRWSLSITDGGRCASPQALASRRCCFTRPPRPQPMTANTNTNQPAL